VIDLPLKRAATPLAPARPGAEPGAGHDLTARPPPADPQQLPVEPPAPKARMLPVWIAAGTAVVAAAAGIWFGASARADERALSGMTTPDGAQADQLAHSAQAKARTANVLFAVAGGAAVAAGTLYVIEARF
jgi:hypothetical protein